MMAFDDVVEPPKSTSQQVIEPKITDSVTKSITISIGEKQSVPITNIKTNIIIRFCCEDGEHRTIIFKVPMSEFMYNDKSYRNTFNKVFLQYMKLSILFLSGSTFDQRNDIRSAIDAKEYIVSGILHDDDGGFTSEFLQEDSEDYYEEYFEEVIKEQGGYERCSEIDIEFSFPVLAISANTSIVSPYTKRNTILPTSTSTSNSPHQGSEDTSNSPHQGSGDIPPVVTPTSCTTMSPIQGSDDQNSPPFIETVNEETLDQGTYTPSKTYNANWRDSPMPKGPWRHKSIQHHVTFEEPSQGGPRNVPPHQQTIQTPHVQPVQQNMHIPNVSINVPQNQMGFSPINPQYAVNSPYHPVPPSYQYSPIQYPVPVHNQMQLPNAFTPTRNTFDISEFGIMSKDRYCTQINRITLDTKTFLKKEYVPSQGTSSLLNWYRRFTAHALRCGIFVPPFESLIPLNILGAWSDGLDPRVTDNLDLMSQMIHSAIINFQAIPIGADFTSILNETCGYVALHNLMRALHPRLTLVPIIRHEPKCKPTESISEYVARWTEFILIEHESERHWRREDVARHIIANLPLQHTLWVQQSYDSLMLSQGQQFDVPPAFHMSMIARTITSIMLKNPYVPREHPRSHQVHALQSTVHEDNVSSDDEDILQVHALRSTSSTTPGDKSCPLCNSTTHDLINCHKYINHCLCTQYAKSHPQSVQDIVVKHKHPPRPFRTGSNSSIRPKTSHSLIADQMVHDIQDAIASESDEQPIESNHSVIHSLKTENMSEYNEDDNSDDDSDYDPTCIRTIDFGFHLDEIYPSETPTVEVHIEPPSIEPLTVVNIVHATANDNHTGPIGGQMDPGANMTTTPHLQMLWNLHKLKRPNITKDAGQSPHQALFGGYLVLPCTRNGQSGHVAISAYYTPSVGVTLLAPSTLLDQYPEIDEWILRANRQIANIKFNDTKGDILMEFPLYCHNKLQYTVPFVRPSISQRTNKLPRFISMSISNKPFIDSIDEIQDNTLLDDLTEFVDLPVSDGTTDSPDSAVQVTHTLHSRSQYQLWHQRLGHVQPRTVSDLHKHVDGVPSLSPPTLLDNCPICLVSKMRRADSSNTDSRIATVCHQSISIDLSFIIMKSKNSDRYIDNVGLRGETCYVAINCYYSGMIHGKTLVNKDPPLEYLNQWLTRFSPDITNKTVRMDQGGELAKCRRVVKLFQDYGYAIQPTGADSSHQNGSIERSHQTIGNMVRSLLHGASLDRKFWPHAFYHALFLMNRIPHHGKPTSPITICSGRRVDLSSLRVFGCRVYVRLPGNRPAKLDSHTRPGIFLGYNETMKNIYWYDADTNQVKTASHARFDEGMVDLPTPPPNVQLLQRIEHDNYVPEADELSIDPVDFQIDSSPFRTIDTLHVTILCEHETFGFELDECHRRHRVYLSSVLPHSSASNLRNIRRKYTGAYIVQVHHTPVYDLIDATAAFVALRQDPNITHFDILLAPDRYVAVRDRREPLRVNAMELQAMTAIRLRLPPCSDCQVHSIATVPDPSRTDHIPITSDELHLHSSGKLTRHRLKKLPTWSAWQASEFKQLDAHHQLHMFGPPIQAPSDAIILYFHWRNTIKQDGTRKSRACCDGSPRAAPALHLDDVNTYSSCVELPCVRLFFAITATIQYYVLLTDAINAYANARGPTKTTYLRVDPAYADWYQARFGVTLTLDMVVEAKHALQGHPEAGKLFEELVNDILLNRMKFSTTSHERNLYLGYFNGHKVYICRQVDDLAIAAPSIAIGQALISAIGQHLTLAGDSLLTKFNGIQVEQSAQYIRIYSEDYISRLCENYGWSTPSNSAYSTVKEPMLDPIYKQLDTDVGPPEHSTEGQQISATAGFSYRSLLGALMYAYVTCRLDIGYAVTKLSQYSANPATIHFTALKHLTLYLRSTKSWGIMYWRPQVLSSLPTGTVPPHTVPTDITLPSFPINYAPTQLVAFVDAAHATDKSRRSVTGYVLLLCGGAICYRSKVQTATTISSTEAELVASVLCAKTVKYMRMVLSELDFPQHLPTPIYEDNAASILIVNASRPTTRTRHIDIQYFAIQDWKQLGQIVLLTIAGIINLADALTKALGWVLHHRHVRRAMGHHACQYTKPPPAASL
jgi:hypothetical protein